MPVGELKLKFKDTVPFAVTVPEERERESVWPNAACVASKKTSARSGQMLSFSG